MENEILDPCSIDTVCATRAKMCARGRNISVLDVSLMRSLVTTLVWAAVHTKFFTVSSQPLGRPVVPEVYTRVAKVVVVDGSRPFENCLVGDVAARCDGCPSHPLRVR